MDGWTTIEYVEIAISKQNVTTKVKRTGTEGKEVKAKCFSFSSFQPLFLHKVLFPSLTLFNKIEIPLFPHTTFPTPTYLPIGRQPNRHPSLAPPSPYLPSLIPTFTPQPTSPSP